MKRILSGIVVFLLLFSVSSLSAEEEPTTESSEMLYPVMFFDTVEEEILKYVNVPYGSSVEPPEVVDPPGYHFVGWDPATGYEYITGNSGFLTVYVEVSPTPKPTATVTPKPTASATPKPTATATPKPTATPTTKSTAEETTLATTVAETGETTATSTTDPTETMSVLPEETTVAEATVTEIVPTSSEPADPDKGTGFDPAIFIWIGAAVLIAGGVVFFVLKRRKDRVK